MGKGAGGQQQNYSGDIVAVIGAGPMDRLDALVMDGATIWPTNVYWAKGIVAIAPVQYTRIGVQFNPGGPIGFYVARVTFDQPHLCAAGKKFILTDMQDPSFDCLAPTVNRGAGAYAIEYLSPGPAVPNTAADAGSFTPSVFYHVGDQVVYSGGAWQCITGHQSDFTNAPPNPDYWVSLAVLRSESPNPFPFTVPKYGQCYWLWGTKDQAWDPETEIGRMMIAYGHPPYRGQAVLILKNFLFGTERQASPNIQVIASRAPNQAVVVGTAAALDADGQANPVACLAELLTEPVFGLGLAPARLEAESWQNTADLLQARIGTFGISAYLDKQDSMRTFVANLLAYFDGWLRWNAAGLLELGLRLHDAAPPAFTAATTIDYHDLVEEIEFSSTLWQDTYNQVVCTFKDMMRAWTDTAQAAKSGYNLAVVGEPRSQKLDRPWISREAQAAAYAAEWCKVWAQPSIAGKLVVRAEKAAAIREGDLFLLTHDALQYSVVCRCTEKALAAPPAGRATLSFTNERGIAPVMYQPSAVGVQGPALPEPELVALYDVVQPPAELVGGSAFMLFALAARRSSLTLGLKMWLRVADEEMFYQLGEQRYWAVAGRCAADYAEDAAGVLQVTLDDFTVAGDLELMSATQTADAVNDNAILVWVVSAADPTVFEIMTLQGLAIVDGVCQLTVRRARYNTAARAAALGDKVWVVRRSDLVGYTHAYFEEYSLAGTPADLRLQAFTASEEADLTDPDECPDVNYTFADIGAPTVSWYGLMKFGPLDSGFVDIADYASGFDPATRFQMSVSVTARSGLARVDMVARQGSVQVNLWLAQFSGDVSAAGTATFTLPSVGVWRVFCEVLDLAGRLRAFELKPDGSSTAVSLRLGLGGVYPGPVLLPDEAYWGYDASLPWPGTALLIPFTLEGTVSPAAPVTVFYQVTLLGAGPAPENYASHVCTGLPDKIALAAPGLPPGQWRTVYAYAGAAGYDISPVYRWDFQVPN